MDKTNTIEENTNDMSSRGWVQDLIQSIANDLAIYNHLTEKLYSLMEDDEGDLTEEITHIQMTMSSVSDTRRRKMKMLENQFVGFDPKMHCALKHAIEGAMEMIEVYSAIITSPRIDQQTRDDADQMFYETHQNLAQILSLAFGLDFDTCWRCVSDQMVSSN